MADRFYSEGSKNNGSAGSSFPAGTSRPSSVNPYTAKANKSLGDFSENIDSNSVRPGQGASGTQKRFEVHINDFDDFLGMPEPPSTPVPQNIPQRKPSSAPSAKRPAQPTGKSPVQSVRQNTAKTVPAAKKVPVNAAKSAPVKKLTGLTSMMKKPAASPKIDVRQSVSEKSAPVKPRKSAVKSSASTKKHLSPEQLERVKAKRRYNFTKGLLAVCVCVFFIAIMTVTASTIAMETINDILVIDKSDNISANITVEQGDEFIDVFNKLENAGFIKQKTLCYIFLMYREYQTVDYEPGIYYLESNDGLEVNIETMMVKRSGSKDTVRLTFPEGWTIAQIFEKIEKYNVCSADKLYANLDMVADQYDFIKEINMKSGRYLKAEGYLFPDTYDFFIDEGPTSVLKKLFANFENRWTGDYTARMNELGMTMDEIINIAAMIQREAKNTSQMSVISSVVHNRLKKSSTFPTLDMNSTRDYITSLKPYKLFSDFYYELYLGTYNTYSAQGLPPGPICNPGAAAIKAALYPAQTDYYFFMHSPSGEIYLAKTADEHQVNTELYL
ncbi:MAG: endolytic transglycosylase MltG [Clostridia bacterium]|nr:endolytic transglycosylase MltG [Clostridia bacterium]